MNDSAPVTIVGRNLKHYCKECDHYGIHMVSQMLNRTVKIVCMRCKNRSRMGLEMAEKLVKQYDGTVS